MKMALQGVYYWCPCYLQDDLGYSLAGTSEITSFGSAGGIIGAIMIGLFSDLLVVRAPVHFVGCSVGAICLAFFSQIRDKSHTVALSILWCSFNAFESGATIMIAVLGLPPWSVRWIRYSL